MLKPITDEEMKQATKTIDAALAKAGVRGVIAELQRYAIYERLRRGTDGAIAIEILHPVHAHREMQRIPGVIPWLQVEPQLHSLDEGLRVWLSDDGPVAELARRVRVLAEEERAAEVRRYEELQAGQVKRARDEAYRQRCAAWRELTAPKRAAQRLGDQRFDANAFADALDAEMKAGSRSVPPPGWQPSPNASTSEANADVKSLNLIPPSRTA